MSPRAESAYSPEEWIGDAEFPWPPTLGIPDGDPVVACFTVNNVSVGRTRTGAPFLKLQLADAHGALEARMWNDVEPVMDRIRTGSYVGVRGCMETYQDQRQLRVDALGLLAIELDDLVLFLPRSTRSPERMDAELAALINSVSDPSLRSLLELLLGPRTETGHAFRLAPAAKQNHHAYLGGLLEHTISVASLCDMLATHYGDAIDRDLLLAGALLHDLGKIREIGARGGFPYTDEGKLLGHILLGLQMVADAAGALPDFPPQRLLLLQHLVASHQGRYEWQSPREPRILEALLLHYADDLDAKMNQAGNLVSGVLAGWTAYDRSLGRDFLRHRQDQAAVIPAAATSAPVLASLAQPEPAQGETGDDEATAGEVAQADTGDPHETTSLPGSADDDPAQRVSGPDDRPGDALDTLDLFE